MNRRIASLAALIPSGDTVPEAIQLLPAGAFRATDGRPDDVDSWQITADLASTLIQAAANRTNPYVIDYEHQTLRAAENGQPAPAAGWLKNLEWRDSGLWAVGVQWTERARTMIASGEYKFISPVFMYDKAGRVTRLLHVALTNDPALDGMAAMAALAFNFDPAPQGRPPAKDTTMTPEMLKLLGLTETATEAEALEALKALVAKLAEAEGGMADLKAKTVPMTAMQDLQGQVAALSAAALAREIDDLVKPALATGRLLPAMEPWARDLGKTNLAALKAFVDSAQPIAALNGTQSGGTPPAGDGKAALSADQSKIASMFGNSADDLAKFR